MKNKKLFNAGFILLTLLVFSFLSCDNKDDEDGPTPMTLLDVVDYESHYNQNVGYFSEEYVYDSLGRLAAIKTYWSQNPQADIDTIIYANGKISKIESYEFGVVSAYKTITFTHSGNQISAASERYGDQVKNYTFTYTGDKLTSFSASYSVGTPDDGELMAASNITWTGNNMTGMDITMQGEAAAISAGATYDTYDNPFPAVDPDDFLTMFCANNCLTAYPTAMPTYYFIHNTYEYTNGLVTKMTSVSENDSTIAELTYKTVDVY